MKNIIGLEHEFKRMENIIVIDWGVSNVCNFKCSYCPDDTHKGNFPFVELNEILDFSNRINSHYRDKLKKEVYFLYTGGEVTLFKDFIKLIKIQNENGNKIGISSNGSKDINFWKEAKKYLNNVSLSYHSEYTDVDHFIKVINEIKNHTTTHVNIMVNPDLFDNCIDVANKVFEQTSEITIDIQMVLRDFIEPYEYTNKQKELIMETSTKFNKNLKITKERDIYRGNMRIIYDDNTNELTKPGDIYIRKLHNFKNWSCNIGLEILVIDIRGDIYKSWCRDCEKIGNIKDKNLFLPEESHICSKASCTGGITDIMTTKRFLRSED